MGRRNKRARRDWLRDEGAERRVTDIHSDVRKESKNRKLEWDVEVCKLLFDSNDLVSAGGMSEGPLAMNRMTLMKVVGLVQ